MTVNVIKKIFKNRDLKESDREHSSSTIAQCASTCLTVNGRQQDCYSRISNVQMCKATMTNVKSVYYHCISVDTFFILCNSTNVDVKL